MTELDHHHENESRYSCSHCEETGIDIESREYCSACELGKRRMNLDRLAEPLRHHPFSNAMWVAHHSAMKTERAIAAAELALLKSKLLQAERELSERAVSPAESVPISERPDVVALRRQDHEQACRVTHALMAERDAWKERADRAEAAIAAAREESYAAGRRNGTRDERIASKAEAEEVAALADRQASDLSREETIALIVRDVAELDYDGSEIDKMEVTPIDLTAILESRLAKPLQQEGGKDLISVLREYLLREMPSGTVINDPTWWAPRIARAITAAPQPSDNLQQASTAQVEPAKEDTFETGYKNLVFVLRCIASGHHNSEELARNVLKHGLLPDAATPAQATPEGAELPPAEYDAAMDRHYIPLPNGWEVQTKGNGSTFRIAHVPTGARYMVLDEDLHEPLTDLANDVRAALAASQQAAEPVSWAQALQFGARVIELYDDATMRESDHMLSSTECSGILEALCSYRAAPPQQIEPLCCNHNCNQGRDCPYRKGEQK